MAKKNKYPMVYFIIAVGGNLKKPSVERMEIIKEEVEEYLEDTDEKEEDAINYFLDEAIAEWSQHFCNAIALTEEEFKNLAKDLKQIPFTP